MEFRQRSLVNRRVALRDTELIVNYIFPFWDRSWSVRFVLIEVFGADEPVVVSPAFEASGADLKLDVRAVDLRPLAGVPRSDFASMYHFDPWWIFRGKGGVAAMFREVVVPTNIARPFLAAGSAWSIHDVSFGPGMATAVAIDAKDPFFRKRTFTNATLDLAAAFGPPRRTFGVPSPPPASPPKVL